MQLAPWNVTKNFILGTQAKGMVKLYGGGDPTGRGEGFSFFRASMKEMFMRAGSSSVELAAYQESIKQTGHRFVIADQQKVYKEEIKRIWATQLHTLSRSEEPELSDEESVRRHRGEEHEGLQEEESQDLQEMMMMITGMEKGKQAADGDGPSSRAVSPISGAQHLSRHPNISQHSLDDMTLETGSLASSRHMRGKSLLIRRKITNDVTGVEEWHEEVILDYRITNAYLKQRRIMQISSGGKNSISLEDDEETRKKKMMQELKLLKREVGRPTPATPKSEIGPDGKVRLGSSQRACRSCGQIGHIKTNRICPNFAINNPERAKKEQEARVVKAENGKLKISVLAMEKTEEKMRKETTLKLPAKVVDSVTAKRQREDDESGDI